MVSVVLSDDLLVADLSRRQSLPCSLTEAHHAAYEEHTSRVHLWRALAGALVREHGVVSVKRCEEKTKGIHIATTTPSRETGTCTITGCKSTCNIGISARVMKKFQCTPYSVTCSYTRLTRHLAHIYSLSTHWILCSLDRNRPQQSK